MDCIVLNVHHNTDQAVQSSFIIGHNIYTMFMLYGLSRFDISTLLNRVGSPTGQSNPILRPAIFLASANLWITFTVVFGQVCDSHTT